MDADIPLVVDTFVHHFSTLYMHSYNIWSEIYSKSLIWSMWLAKNLTPPPKKKKKKQKLYSIFKNSCRALQGRVLRPFELNYNFWLCLLLSLKPIYSSCLCMCQHNIKTWHLWKSLKTCHKTRSQFGISQTFQCFPHYQEQGKLKKSLGFMYKLSRGT